MQHWGLAVLAFALGFWPPPALAQDRETAARPEAPRGESSPHGSLPAALAWPTSSTQNRQEARRLYFQGTHHVEAGEWMLAQSAYRRSFELYPSPSTLVNLAYCEGQLGHLVEAWLLLSRALVLFERESGPGSSSQRQAAAQAERARLQARLPSVVLQGPGRAELFVAGARIVPIEGMSGVYRLQAATQATWAALPVGSRIYLDPGKYRIGQRWQGQATYQDLELSEGAVFALVVAPPPDPTPVEPMQSRTLTPDATARSPTPTTPMQTRPSTPLIAAAPSTTAPRPYQALGIGSLIAGGVAFTTALVSAGVLLDAESKLGARCSSQAICPPELTSTVSRYETAAVVTNVSLISGIAASAIGLGLLLADGESAEPGVAVQASVSGIRVRVWF